MRVPTYKAQTTLTQQTGGRQMGVRYTAEEFGATVARAQGQLAQQVARSASALNTQRLRAEEKQRLADEEDERIATGLAKDKAVNEFLEGAEGVAVEASELPIEEQEAFYDRKIGELKKALQGRFEKEEDQLDIGNKVDRIALGKRIGIKAGIRTRRIEESIAQNAQTEKTLITSAINGQGAELEGTLIQLDEMYSGMVKRGLMTATDAERRKSEVTDKILFEREVNIANNINDPQKAQEFITRIEADERFDPTVRRRLASMVTGLLSGKESTLKAHKSQFTDDIQSLDAVVSAGEVIPESELEAMEQAAALLDSATGDVKYSRDFRQIREKNENVKIFAANMSVDSIDSIIDQAESELEGRFEGIEERGYAADRLKGAREFKEKMVAAYQGGTGLDFVQKRNPEMVQAFDFTDFSGSLARRQTEMRALNGLVGYDSFTNKPVYEQNFFTESEITQFSQLLDRASSDEMESIAVSLQQAGRRYPQLFEQLAGARGDGDVFAMAGAISMERSPGESQVIFKGLGMIRQDSSLAPSQDDYLSVFDNYVGDVYLQPGMEGDVHATVKKAAVAHYLGSGGTKADFDSEKFEKSLKAVTGGIGDVNNHKVELPVDVSEELFQKIIDGMTPEMLKELEPRGFDAVNVDSNRAIEIIQNNRLVSMGNNRYGIVDPETGLPVLQTTRLDGTREGLRITITKKLQDYLPSEQTIFGMRVIDLPEEGGVDLLYGEGGLRFVQ